MPEENKKIVVENNNTNTQTQPIPIKKNEYVASRPFSAKQTVVWNEFRVIDVFVKLVDECEFCLGDYDDFL